MFKLKPAGPPIRRRIANIIRPHLPLPHVCLAEEIAEAVVTELELTVESAGHLSRALGLPTQQRWVTPYERQP